MMRLTATLLCALPLLALACARHHVVERNLGHVDGARSIMTHGDPEWTVEREPTGEPNEQR